MPALLVGFSTILVARALLTFASPFANSFFSVAYNTTNLGELALLPPPVYRVTPGKWLLPSAGMDIRKRSTSKSKLLITKQKIFLKQHQTFVIFSLLFPLLVSLSWIYLGWAVVIEATNARTATPKQPTSSTPSTSVKTPH